MSFKSTAWVVKSVAAAGTNTSKLLPFQFAIANATTYNAIGVAGKGGNRKVLFALGSPNQKKMETGSSNQKFTNAYSNNMSFKTGVLEGSSIDSVTIHTPTTELKPNVYYLGYDGLNICDGIVMNCGKKYEFTIRAKGRPIRTYFGGPDAYTESIWVDGGCCDDCVTNCPASPTNVAHLHIDKLIADLNASQHLGQFATFSKVETCTPARPVPTKTNFTSYCITLCDNGDENDLAKLQNAYPLLDISVKSRNAPNTTYEFMQLSVTAVPASYVQSGYTLSNCDTCVNTPGFTLVAGGIQLLVDIDNAGTGTNAGAWLTEVQTVIPTATAATKIGFVHGTGTYLVTVPSSWTAPLTPLTDAVITQVLGPISSYCSQTTPVTTAWADCGTCYKITRDLCMEATNPDCLAPALLAQVQAAYATHPEVVVGSITQDVAGTCRSKFTITQWSKNCMTDGCDTYGHDGAKFNDLPSFEGNPWTVCPCIGWTVNVDGCPVPPDPTERCCMIGIKIETKLIEGDDSSCLDEYGPIKQWGEVEFEMFMTENTTDSGICVKPQMLKWTHAQRYAEPTLTGVEVFKDVIRYRLDKGEMWCNPNSSEAAAFNRAEGFKYGVNRDAAYRLLKVRYHAKNDATAYHIGDQVKQELNLYVLAEDVVLFEQLKAQVVAYSASEGGCSAEVEVIC